MKNGLRNAVIMTGAIAHSRVPEMLSIADVAVVPSAPLAARHGGTGAPLKLFEYMAAGKAIVATALDQAGEVAQDGRTHDEHENHAGGAQGLLDGLDEPFPAQIPF